MKLYTKYPSDQKIKSQWFAVTSTLCLTVILFTAIGCNKSETSSTYYTVKFAGIGVDIEQQSILHGEHAIEPENHEKEGYSFNGWFTDNGTFAKKWDFKTGIVTQDTTLYAKWKDNTLQEINLRGTEWKLECIVNIETGVLRELEPKDCAGCYTLTFEKDDSYYYGSTFVNSIAGSYEIDYETYTFCFTNVGGTEVGSLIGDDTFYRSFLWKIQFFTIIDAYLYLYHNESNNYLKYKKIGDKYEYR